VLIGNSVELILEIKNLQSISIQFFCHQSLLYKIIVNQLQCAATEMAHLGRMDQMGRLLKNKAKWTEPLPVESDKKKGHLDAKTKWPLPNQVMDISVTHFSDISP